MILGVIFMQRTHYCGELRKSHVGQKGRLLGWGWHWRDHGGVVFIDLRDREGGVQLVFNPERDAELHRRSNEIRSEYVIAIEGTVSLRTPETVNSKIATGEVEVFVDKMDVLNKAETPPFPIEDYVEVGEDIRLQYRYIDLRRPVMLSRMKTRHRAYQIVRNYLSAQGFFEVETPMLAKSTPEGARDYLVPSRVHEHHFYALPQSPQLFKQLLMVAGLDRYFQIVKCFRDEDLRADRQPEFTQIDIEMSFPESDVFYGIMEGLVANLWKEILGYEIPRPFERMPYPEAMERFGCDRPDRRFGLELCHVSDIAKDSQFKVFQDIIAQGGMISGLNLKGCAKYSRKEIDELTAFAGQFGARGMSWMKVTEKGLESNIVKFFPEEVQMRLRQRMGAEMGDLLVFIADTAHEVVSDVLSRIRLHIGRRENLIDTSRWDFFWVVDFPLFVKDENGRPTPSHHPFTSPHPEDLKHLESDPLKVRSLAYDMILNGNEIGGGSVRIHDPNVQSRIFKAIGIDDEEAKDRFGFLLEAFKYGAPPHGGIAFGFDRIAMLLTNTDNIRDVIAFPKTQRATSLMDGSPSHVKEEQLRELHIKLR
jgi:aspartyl-tRNA synthetase